MPRAIVSTVPTKLTSSAGKHPETPAIKGSWRTYWAPRQSLSRNLLFHFQNRVRFLSEVIRTLVL